MTPRKTATFLGYGFNYDDELALVIPDWWEQSTERRRECLNSIIDHIKPVNVEGCEHELFVIEVATSSMLGYSDRMWKEVIESCGLFIVHDATYSKVKGKAKLYRFSELGRELFILREHTTSCEFDPILEIFYGGELLKLKQSKVPKRVWDRGDWDYKIDCHLNYEMLKSLVETEQQNGKEVAHTSLIFKRLQKTQGNFIQLYRRIKSGRLYGMNNTNLQNLPKLARERLFAGCYDVDMVNAHYSLTYQIFLQNFNAHPDHLYDYVTGRSYIRQKLSKELGISVEDIKTALLILLYGGGKKFGALAHNPYEKLLGQERARAFLTHEFVCGLDSEISTLVTELRPELNRIILQENLKNKSLRSALAFKLQSIEAEILDLCIRLYKPEALYFDGFITKEEVDCEVLEDYVAANSEYIIQFDCKLLEVTSED